MAEAEQRMEEYGMKCYTLPGIQGEKSDSALMLLHELNAENKAMTEEKKQLLELSTRNNELHARLNNYALRTTGGGDGTGAEGTVPTGEEGVSGQRDGTTDGHGTDLPLRGGHGGSGWQQEDGSRGT